MQINFIIFCKACWHAALSAARKGGREEGEREEARREIFHFLFKINKFPGLLSFTYCEDEE